MKKAIIFLTIFLVGCSKVENKENHDTINELLNNFELEAVEKLDFEYAEKVYLYDLFKYKEFITDENILLDTSTLGSKKITVNYKFNGKEESKEITYNVVDSTPPVINAFNLTTTTGKKISFLDNLMCGDNYDREVKCEIIGDYNFNKAGTYPLKIRATDSSENQTEKDFKLIVQDQSNNNYTSNYYYFDDLIKKYKTDKTMVGIDVSSWQGNINWEKVKAAGCEFVMIRIGYGFNKKNENVFDTRFKNNLKNAKKAGLKVGLYYYSYAKTKEEAAAQAKWIVDTLNGETLDLPIAFDWEIWGGFSNYKMNFNDLNEIAESFINEINKANYEGVNYSSAYFANNVWNLNSRTWLAWYTDNNTFEKPYFMWQLSSIGKINGISEYVDLDILYLD